MRVRIRRIAKWGCLSLGSVMLIAAVVGYWWKMGVGLAWDSPTLNTFTIVRVDTSSIVIDRRRGSDGPMFTVLSVWERRIVHASFWPNVHREPAHWSLRVPTSNLAILTLVPGVILWRLDRHRAAHECPKCRYDRRGLAEGAVCPECGAG